MPARIKLKVKNIELNDSVFLLKELKGNECACGGYKKGGNSLCYKCYSSLPDDMQKDLYQRFGNGYEEAYDNAVGWLNVWEWE
jgi:hypothetical protein